MNRKLIVGTLAVALQCFVPVSTSMAAGYLTNIQFCSRFAHKIWISVAYPSQGDGTSPGDWVSRGWADITANTCTYFDNALHLATFYYRAVSVPYRLNGRSVTASWGSEGTTLKSFRVANDYDAYNYWQSDLKSMVQRGDSFAPFTIYYGDHKDTVDSGHADLTITFNADATSSVDLTIPAPK